jgi:hypothetical protein
MSTSRSSFYSYLQAMLGLCNNELLVDVFPISDSHNLSARLLRHGLAISAFSSLERYTEARFKELLRSINKSKLHFNDFDDKLKKFISIDAASGIINQLKFKEKNEQQQFFDDAIKQLSGYHTGPFSYTAFGFSPSGSNVGHEDIKNAIGALGVEGGWSVLKDITTKIGSSRLDLLNDYKNLSRVRNNSAHNPDSNVPTADLITHIQIAILIGISVDVLACEITDAYIKSSSLEELKKRLRTIDFQFRFIDHLPNGSVEERNSLSGKVLKRYPNELSALAGAQSRARTAHVIIRSPASVPLALA